MGSFRKMHKRKYIQNKTQKYSKKVHCVRTGNGNITTNYVKLKLPTNYIFYDHRTVAARG